MTASTSGWAVECTPPDSPEFSYTRPCESFDHAFAVLRGLPGHYLPARVRTPKEAAMTTYTGAARANRRVIYTQRAAHRAIGATNDALELMAEGRLADAANFFTEAERHLDRAKRMLKEARDDR